LSKDLHWRQLLNYCQANNSYLGTPPPDDPKDEDELLHSFSELRLDEEEDLEGDEALSISKIAREEDPAWKQEM